MATLLIRARHVVAVMAFTFTISNLVVARAADNIRRHSRTDHSHHEAIINGHEATGLEDYEPPLAAVRAAEQAEHESELQESHSVDPVIPLTPPNPKPSKRVGVIAKELMHEIYMDDDPMSHPPGIKPDWSYGHTNFQTGVFNALLDMYVPNSDSTSRLEASRRAALSSRRTSSKEEANTT